MKKSLFIISAAAVLLAGCAKEQLVEQKAQNGPVNVVSATFEDLVGDDATKAAVADDGTFTWQNGDEAAFAGESAYLQAQNSSTGATASFSFSGTLAASTYGIFPYDLTESQSVNDGKVSVPASRDWAENQTNVAMYATYASASNSFSFEHLGGLVKVTINNVPTTATKFVFKTEGWKINGVFDISIDTDSKKKITTSSTTTDSEMEYTLTFTAPSSEGTSKVFYIPLPTGTYNKGFAVYLKDANGTTLSQFKGSTSQTVNRKSFLRMPAITLASASIEEVYKDALVETIPAGYSGDFLLPETDKLILKIKASSENHDITLKYKGENKPTKLEIKVFDDDTENAGNFNAKLLGDLPYTHVDFTLGNIDHTLLTTSASTFAVIHPATVGTLTVKGGNVVLKGATVNMIEVAKNAVADASSNASVEIKMENYTPEVGSVQTPVVTGSVVAEANVKVAPVKSQIVTVVKVGSVTVQDTGLGTVEEKDNEVSASTFNEFKNAITTVVAGQTIKVTENISNASGISVAEGKNFTVDFGGHTYTGLGNPVGSTGTENQVFQLLQNSTITFKNGTIDLATTNQNKFRFLIQNYANLTLEDIILDGTNLAITDRDRYTISNNCGTVEFKGITTIKAATERGIAFDVCKYASYDAPTVTWNSTGEVTGEIELTGGEFVVAKPLALTQPIRTKDAAAKLTVNANITPATSWTSANASDGLVIVKRKADLTIDGTAKISYNSNEQVYCAVKMTEKDDASDNTNRAKLTVKGTVTLEGYNAGISGNGNSGRGNTDVTVEGGTIKGCKASGDECCGIYQPQVGTLTINGGTIEGLVGVYVKSGSVTTAVSGGTIKGTGAKGTYSPQGDGFINTGDAIVFDNCDYPGGEPNATINGGTFISANGNAVASYAKEGKTPITGFIHGGTFSDLSGLEYVAENGTYKLANNVNLGENILEINSGKTFSIDLNGKTLTGRTNIKHGNVTFKNGNIAGGNKQALNVYGSSTEATNYSVVTVDSDVTVTADVYAVCVFGATAGGTGYGAVANIAGTINTNGDTKNGAIFVSGNLGSKADNDWAVSSKNAVNIQNGAKITSSTDAALALNGSAKVTVASGAELTGATAIAAKRGKLIVNGGTITGTMDPGKSDPDTYMNGTEMTGSAVSATASYKADGPLSVEIKDGTFTSKAYTILNNHDGCEFEISDGNFTTTMATNGITVYARLGSVNITGGEFTNNSNGEATLHVGCPTANHTNGPKLTISGDGTVVKNNASGNYTYGGKPLVVNMANQLTYKAVEISGGKFYYRDPSKDDNVQGDNGNFLKSGYSASGNDTNGYTVSATPSGN